MDLSDQIVEALRARNMAGETYEQIGKSCGVSHAHIHRLANRRSDPLKMSLEKFLALFPSAQIELAPARAQDDPAASNLARELAVVRAERDSLRRELETLRRLADVLDARVRDLEQRPPFTLDGPGSRAPYILEPSTSSPSNK